MPHFDDYRPKILVAPRWQTFKPTIAIPEQLADEETMSSAFSEALIAAGALPIMAALHEDTSLLDEYIELCDGVAIPGGQDVNPAIWGDTTPYDEELLCPKRDVFEIELVKRTLAAHKPLFATCRGAQILNVALGGTLCMDVTSLKPRPHAALWRHQMILHDAAHPVEVSPHTLLSRCIGNADLIQTNSSHHCCIAELGEGVQITAVATDGIPEAIEVGAKRFCLGVQWHPEYTWKTIPTDFALWTSFVDACRTAHED